VGHETGRRAFLLGYVHYFIFASIAAVGVGISILVNHYTHESHASLLTASLTLSIPVAVYLICPPLPAATDHPAMRIASWVAALFAVMLGFKSGAALSIALLLAVLTALLL